MIAADQATDGESMLICLEYLDGCLVLLVIMGGVRGHSGEMIERGWLFSCCLKKIYKKIFNMFTHRSS